MFLLSCLVPAQRQSLGWRPFFSVHELALSSSLWVGALAVSRPAELVKSQENRRRSGTTRENDQLDWLGFGVYCLVRLNLPDSPLGESGRQPRKFGFLPSP